MSVTPHKFGHLAVSNQANPRLANPTPGPDNLPRGGSLEPRSQLSAHDLVQVLGEIPNVAAVQPRHGDTPVLCQVDVRLLRQRLALLWADSREAARKRGELASDRNNMPTMPDNRRYAWLAQRYGLPISAARHAASRVSPAHAPHLTNPGCSSLFRVYVCARPPRRHVSQRDISSTPARARHDDPTRFPPRQDACSAPDALAHSISQKTHSIHPCRAPSLASERLSATRRNQDGSHPSHTHEPIACAHSWPQNTQRQGRTLQPLRGGREGAMSTHAGPDRRANGRRTRGRDPACLPTTELSPTGSAAPRPGTRRRRPAHG